MATFQELLNTLLNPKPSSSKLTPNSMIGSTSGPITMTQDGQTFIKQYNPQDGNYYYVPQSEIGSQRPSAKQPFMNTMQTPVNVQQSVQSGGISNPNPTAKSALIAGDMGAGPNPPPNATPTQEQGKIPGKFDINPETGKPYGFNPATNSMDDNFWAEKVEPALREKYLSEPQKSLLTQNQQSGVDKDAIRQGLMKELEPYYARLLNESNGDIELAKKRMEEDYQKGLRVAREDSDTSVKNAIQTLIPNEQDQLYGELNRRGLVGTREGRIDAPSATLSTGQKVISPLGTNVKFGGLGGKMQGQLISTQKARSEAVQRALQRQEEELGLTRNRSMEDYTTKQTRNTANLQQQKNVDLQTGTEERYKNALGDNYMRSNILLGG